MTIEEERQEIKEREFCRVGGEGGGERRKICYSFQSRK